MRRGGDRRLGRRVLRSVDVDRERLVAALDRHHRVVDGDRDVGEDRVTFGGCQCRGGECLAPDGVPGRDVRIGRSRGLLFRAARAGGAECGEHDE